ncbi:DsrE/DsrF/TusD sulfur relay family protein [Gimesia sp.]|uniref:DsrE/DsrF/TusD sulfur relay family protein n=1 Tax=Gimesia sp. TaxID=2024833 RepID=UPI003A953520
MAGCLIILNGPPYGNEYSYNGLRLAGSLVRQPGNNVKVFLLGDAAACARAGQKVPQGYYNLELMLHQFHKHGGEVGVCATCMDARALSAEELVEGCHRSSLDELTKWTMDADKVLVF